MEAQWIRKRQQLYYLRQSQPNWSKVRLAQEVGGSYSWTKKWCQRFEQRQGEDDDLFQSQSRARHNPPPPIDQEVVLEIIKIRDDPPEGLRRTPGPLTIQYYLERSESLSEALKAKPPCPKTIWRVLDRYQRIERKSKADPEPTSRAAPLTVLQMDFKDVPGIKVPDSPKKQHQVETLNIVDTGTSVLIDNQVRTDYNAESVIDSLSQTFQQWGLPGQLEFDRDPRFVGASTSGDFPSALMRFLSCLGIDYVIHPPHRPDKNGFVERLNRTYKREGILFDLPQDLEQVEQMNHNFRYYYNYLRPHQAPTCGNKPPRVAFAELPSLPSLPDQVDPDAWLRPLDGTYFQRKIDASGRFQLGKQRYYVRRDLARHKVLIEVQAPQKTLQVRLADQIVKTLPIKGLFEGILPYEQYLTLIKKEAYSEWQHYLRTKTRYTALAG